MTCDIHNQLNETGQSLAKTMECKCKRLGASVHFYVNIFVCMHTVHSMLQASLLPGMEVAHASPRDAGNKMQNKQIPAAMQSCQLKWLHVNNEGVGSQAGSRLHELRPGQELGAAFFDCYCDGIAPPPPGSRASPGTGAGPQMAVGPTR